MRLGLSLWLRFEIHDVYVFAQRTDATNRFAFWLRFGQKRFRIDLKIDFKIVCGGGCVSAPKPFVPFSRSLNGSSLRSNLWFELRFSPETPNPFNTMKSVETEQ